MARINLLPWREERRRQLAQEFARQAMLAAILAAAVGGYAWYYVNGLISEQSARNSYLEEQTAILKKDIKEIREFESTKKKLLARMDVIQRLQTRRPQIVHLFYELAATLPDGVHLTGVTQKGDQLTLNGLTRSNARVSAYMRNLDASPWLKNPRLEIIKTEEGNLNTFRLQLAQTTPDDAQTPDGEQTQTAGGEPSSGGST